MKDRLKALRKALRLNQSEFGARIGTVQNTITGYETGRHEPSNQVITLICKEFRVNETWLRTGEGEMFLPEPKNEVDELLERHGLTENERIAFECYLRLSEDERAALMKFLNDYADNRVAEEPAPEPTEEELVEEYKRQLRLEKKVRAKSEASSEVKLRKEG